MTIVTRCRGTCMLLFRSPNSLLWGSLLEKGWPRYALGRVPRSLSALCPPRTLSAMCPPRFRLLSALCPAWIRFGRFSKAYPPRVRLLSALSPLWPRLQTLSAMSAYVLALAGPLSALCPLFGLVCPVLSSCPPQCPLFVWPPLPAVLLSALQLRRAFEPCLLFFPFVRFCCICIVCVCSSFVCFCLELGRAGPLCSAGPRLNHLSLSHWYCMLHALLISSTTSVFCLRQGQVQKPFCAWKLFGVYAGVICCQAFQLVCLLCPASHHNLVTSRTWAKIEPCCFAENRIHPENSAKRRRKKGAKKLVEVEPQSVSCSVKQVVFISQNCHNTWNAHCCLWCWECQAKACRSIWSDSISCFVTSAGVFLHITHLGSSSLETRLRDESCSHTPSLYRSKWYRWNRYQVS